MKYNQIVYFEVIMLLGHPAKTKTRKLTTKKKTQLKTKADKKEKDIR